MEDVDDWERREEAIRILKYQVSGMGRQKAESIIDEFGSIEALEESNLEEVTAIEGIGPTMADRIGIWDERGNPVGSITKNPCPICGREYDRELEESYDVERSITVSELDEVCLKVSHPRGGGIGSSPPTITRVFTHKS